MGSICSHNYQIIWSLQNNLISIHQVGFKKMMLSSQRQCTAKSRLPIFPPLVGSTLDSHTDASVAVTWLKPRKQSISRNEMMRLSSPEFPEDAAEEPELPITPSDILLNDTSFATPRGIHCIRTPVTSTSSDFPSFPALPSLSASNPATHSYEMPTCITLAPRVHSTKLRSPRGVDYVEQMEIQDEGYWASPRNESIAFPVLTFASPRADSFVISDLTLAAPRTP